MPHLVAETNSIEVNESSRFCWRTQLDAQFL